MKLQKLCYYCQAWSLVWDYAYRQTRVSEGVLQSNISVSTTETSNQNVSEQGMVVSNKETVLNHTADNIAQIGLSQVGYVPDEYNVTKYHSDFGKSQGQDWCGIFVGWCCVQAGREDLLPSNLALASSWAEGDSVVSANSGYTPKAGDIVYFSRGHVGIVTDYHDGTVYTVEGNTYVPGYSLYGVWDRNYPIGECTAFRCQQPGMSVRNSLITESYFNCLIGTL